MRMCWISWSEFTCDWECDKACEIGEFVDFRECIYKKHVFQKLTEECEDDDNIETI